MYNIRTSEFDGVGPAMGKLIKGNGNQDVQCLFTNLPQVELLSWNVEYLAPDGRIEGLSDRRILDMKLRNTVACEHEEGRGRKGEEEKGSLWEWPRISISKCR